jgi:hypothetical protein
MSETIEEALIKHSERIAELEAQKAALLKALRRIAETDFDGTEAIGFQEWAQGLALDAIADAA